MLEKLIGKLAGGEHDQTIATYVTSHIKSSSVPKFENTVAGREILKLEPSARIAVLCRVFELHGAKLRRYAAEAERMDAYDARDEIDRKEYEEISGAWASTHHQRRALEQLAVELLERDLPLTAEDLVQLCNIAMDPQTAWPEDWPLLPLIRAIEKFAAENEIPKPLYEALERLIGFAGTGERAETRKLAARILAVLGQRQGAPDFMLIGSEWGKRVVASFNALGKDDQEAWGAIFRHAAEIQEKTKPTAKWLEDSRALVAKLGEDSFADVFGEWVESFDADNAYQEPNTDFIKALIWAASRVESDRLPPVVGRFCELCYKKISGIGPANIKLGNAGFYALGRFGERGVAELVRLKSRIKFNQGRKKLDEALAAAADHAGLTVVDLEEMALPTFGLDADGSRLVALGESTAEIRVAGSDQVALHWIGADGKPRKSVPASVKADHADELKALRGEIKEIKGLLAGQRFRLESLYLQGRSWSLADWRKRYLEHPLLANLSRRLIWNFAQNGKTVAALPASGGPIAIDGKDLDWPGDAAVVSLWHPLDADADGVQAWRQRLAALDIVQPFKQAHRELYRLTGAERATGTYSNRFAAHILRQHQMNALCQARGWRYNLQGAWDQEQSVPTRVLPGGKLRCEFWVDHAGGDYLENGVYLYRATDQVLFFDELGEPVRLEEVPPLAFSELMRDIDLFVGVASVGNNPAWQDGGPDGRFRDYWWEYSFGDLGRDREDTPRRAGRPAAETEDRR